ncbi:sensor histidine kinase [Blautia sp. HCP3S3_G3]|uniref:sensor histidine kinase n=1 Tax=Blautia sp. HCP3S3_G3 TaxID=3438913 RepID=UPI003F89577F
MKNFYLSSALAQTILLVALFLTLILSLFLQLTAYGRQRDKWKKYLHLSVFLFLLILLSVLADASSQINEGLQYKTWLPLPMWLLWCITFAADFLMIWDIAGLCRLRRQALGRDSIKQALDMLPSGICYFAPSGRVKLCNRQMDSLFHTISQGDLQTLAELQDALSDCDACSGVIRLSWERQTYLFPDGKAWRYRQSEVKASDGATYTEAVFSDITELYNKNLELKAQIKQLNAISRELKWLSDNALILTREKEVLSAKTKLHDDMGAGLIAIRHILHHNRTEEEANAMDLFRQAVSAIKYDNAYPRGRSELDRFLHDAEAIGIKVNLSGDLPEQEELRHVMILAMRECLTNSVRHAGATTIHITAEKKGDSVSVKITNDGRSPETEVIPKGGLHNLYRHIIDFGGTMEIQSKPSFALTVVLPVI